VGPVKHAHILEAAGILAVLLLLFFWPATLGGRVLLPADLVFDLDPLWAPLAPEGYTHPGNQLLADQVYQFFPWKTFTRRSLAQGTLPLWNPYTAGGQPFVGNGQSALFDPFNLLGRLFPLYTSYVVVAFLRLFVAGLSTYLFAREIGISKIGALLAMISFTFSGPMIVWLGYPLASVVAWLPAMLLCIERALSRRSIPYTLACGIIIGFQFLGGQPEVSFQVMVIWAVYALYRVFRPGASTGRLENPPYTVERGFLTIVLAALIGALLAAVQLLPFVEAFFQSAALSGREVVSGVSVKDLVVRIVASWEAWPTAITTILPNYFGTPLDHSYWFPYGNYAENQSYAGLLPLVLALSLVAGSCKHCGAKHRHWITFFASLGIISFGMALRLPLFNALNLLPLFNIAAPGRLRFAYVLSVALLAGMGADCWTVPAPGCALAPSASSPIDAIGLFQSAANNQPGTWRTTLRLLFAIAVFSLLLAGLTYAGFRYFRDPLIASGRAFMASSQDHPYMWRSLAYYYDLVETRYQAKLALFTPTSVKASNYAMYVPLLIASAALLSSKLLSSRTAADSEGRDGASPNPLPLGEGATAPQSDVPHSGGLKGCPSLGCTNLQSGGKSLAWAILALTVLDLFIIGMPFNATTAPEHIVPTPDAIRFLQRDEGIHRICATGTILNPNSSILFKLADVRSYDAMIPNRYITLLNHIDGHYHLPFHSLFTNLHNPLLDLLNVKYALTTNDLSSLDQPGGKWELVYEGEALDSVGADCSSPVDARTGTVRIYRNRNVQPRAFLVYEAEVAPDAQASLARVTSEGFDFRREVVLESSPAPALSPAEATSPPLPPPLEGRTFSADCSNPSLSPPRNGRAHVSITAYEPNRVAMRVDAPADAWLVFTDTYAPGWKVWVDGEEQPLYIANHAFRAVGVPGGQHQVVFRYVPLSFRAGAVISVLTLAIMLLSLAKVQR